MLVVSLEYAKHESTWYTIVFQASTHSWISTHVHVTVLAV